MTCNPQEQEPLAQMLLFARIRFFTGFLTMLFGLLAPTAVVRAQVLSPGNALNFRGTTNDYAIGTNFSAFPSNSVTVELWTRSTNANPGALFSYAVPGDDNELLIYGTTNLQLFVNNQSTVFTTISIADGKWHHVAMTWTNSGSLQLYIDGILKFQQSGLAVSRTIPSGGTLVLAQDQDTSGGGFQSAQSYAGDMDEIRIWNRVLTSSEIASNMNHSLSNSTPGLVAYYRFDETSGTVATNSIDTTTNSLRLIGSVTRPASTVPFAPVVLSANATLISTNTATIVGSVLANNLPLSYQFQWGTTNNPYSSSSSVLLLPATNTAASISFNVPGLTLGQTYHYRLVATNSAGNSTSADQTFTEGFLVVTNFADAGPGSLRFAVQSAGAGALITFATNGTITLTSGELVLSNSFTIAGPGATNLVIDAAGHSRIFNILTNVALRISDLTLTHGQSPAGADANFLVNTPAYPGSPGGGIYNMGSLLLNHCVLTANVSGRGGNGAFNSGAAGGSGGAIYNGGTLVCNGCLLSGNICGNGGGASGGAGALFIGGNGGAICNAGELAATNCTFSGNLAGISTGHGGALYNVGTAVASGCLFVSNAAGNGSQEFVTGDAGGSGGAILSSGGLTLVNCTVSQNSPGLGGLGGGLGGPGSGTGPSGQGSIYLTAAATGQLIACTIVSNSIDGGVVNVIAANTTLLNCLVAANAGNDISGPATSGGHNLMGTTGGTNGFVNGVNGDIAGTVDAPIDPVIGPLADNGGPTLTHPLLPNSPALEGGADALLGPPYNLTTDQRGLPRASGVHPDIGAYEQNLSLWPAVSLTTGGATVSSDPVTGASVIQFSGTINPGGLRASTAVQYGLTPGYGAVTTPVLPVAGGTNSVPLSFAASGLGNGSVIHYRVIGTNLDGMVLGQDQTVLLPLSHPAGDIDGDGLISQTELDTVLGNYFQASPWLYMTNVAGLGGTNVTFQLTNSLAGSFTVQYSTNLSDWQDLGSAIPRYGFTDTNAPALPQRYYRLHWP